MDEQINLSQLLYEKKWTGKKTRNFLIICLIVFLVFMFLPWTQNVSTYGKVTAISPGQRPQQIQTIIDGKLEKWYVKEGDFVKQGDTIAKISEVKNEYLDPDLINQTNKQIRAKENSVESYSDKIGSINKQIDQLEIARDLKLEQAELKYKQEKEKLLSEQAEYKAQQEAVGVSRAQYVRDSVLCYRDKIKSKQEVENKYRTWQNDIAKLRVAANKINIAQQAVLSAKIEVSTLNADYNEKLAKAESDRQSAVSNQMESEAEVSKLRNQASNYIIRQGFYIITSPQDGFINEAKVSGIGEIIKTGSTICTIVPSSANLAVELYINPVDMPLISKNTEVNLQFDGWPTIVFSGWPDMTFGTFKGKVFAIDNAPSSNGKFKVMVSPIETASKKWPTNVKIGTGSRGFMLLKNVRVWYEMWRQLNGFPADFYVPEKTEKTKEDDK